MICSECKTNVLWKLKENYNRGFYPCVCKIGFCQCLEKVWTYRDEQNFKIIYFSEKDRSVTIQREDKNAEKCGNRRNISIGNY